MIDRPWTPYCGPAPDPAEWLGRWNLDPLVLTTLAFGALAGWVLMRRGRVGPTLFAALGVLALIFISPLCALGSALFTGRTLHHLLLVLAAAPLLALALPCPRRVHLLAAVVVQAVVFWVWHAPGLYAGALSHDGVYWIMQATLLGSAVWFWSAIRAASAPAAVAGLLAAMLLMGLLGAVIVFAGQPLYAPHFGTTLAWGMTPLEDQQAAGLIMWAPAAAAYLAVALWRLNGLLRGPGRASAA